MWPLCAALERDGPPPTGEVDPNVCSPRVLPGRPTLRIVVFLGCAPSGKGGLEPQGHWKFYFLILVVVTRGCRRQPESLSGTLQAVKLRCAGLRGRQGELVGIRAVRSSRRGRCLPCPIPGRAGPGRVFVLEATGCGWLLGRKAAGRWGKGLSLSREHVREIETRGHTYTVFQ